jgi:hypothetical protein
MFLDVLAAVSESSDIPVMRETARGIFSSIGKRLR